MSVTAWHPFEEPWNEFHPAGCDARHEELLLASLSVRLITHTQQSLVHRRTSVCYFSISESFCSYFELDFKMFCFQVNISYFDVSM